jgi:hypothetical protein
MPIFIVGLTGALEFAESNLEKDGLALAFVWFTSADPPMLRMDKANRRKNKIR